MRENKASRTAYKVALSIVTLGAKPGMAEVLPPGIVEATAKLLIASGAARAKTVQWSRTRGMVFAYEAFDWMMPGQFEAFAHRKAFCERQVRESVAAGASQVLVLGAGYDTMGWRLAPEFPDVDFFEIDHPATSRLKAKGIEEMGLHRNLHLIGEDLGKRKLVEVLAHDEAWNLNVPTTIVAEGLLQYLSPQAVRDLFTQCASIAAESKIAFTYVPTREDGRPDAGWLTGLNLWLLKKTGEPWLWSVRSEELDQLLEASGWTNAPEMVGTAGKRGLELYAVATK